MSHSSPPLAHTDQGFTNSRLNPRAMDFAPTTRGSSKRKASSSARSGLSVTHSLPPVSSEEQPLISVAQIFSSSATENPVRSEDAEDSDESFEFEDALFGRGIRPFQGLNLNFPLLQLFTPPSRAQRASSTSFRTPDIPRPLSESPGVILIQEAGKHGPLSKHNALATSQVRYLPLCHVSSKSDKDDLTKYAILPDYASRVQRTASNVDTATASVTWPKDGLPVELFELIGRHLARDDIKSMRLVNKEFERKVCRSLFRTAVVPFNTELYDMIIDKSKKDGHAAPLSKKRKGKMKAREEETDTWTWTNAKEDKEGKVYRGHGLRVFQGFGGYIKRFGMSFEVAESQLASPPGKQLLDPVKSYHGTYEWPSANYARFTKLNRLEETADETSRMKAAFSNLAHVLELGLSVRNGLGWLEGPDRSFRAALLQNAGVVFGSPQSERSGQEVLSITRHCVRQAVPNVNFKEITLEQRPLRKTLNAIDELYGTCFAESQFWPTLDRDPLDDPTVKTSPDGVKVVFVSTEPNGSMKLGNIQLSPNELRKEQKEWLLETEWAQRAFLESYILAVMDNPVVFSQVTTLKIACLSSGLLPVMSRGMFWDALPSLTTVTLHVSADWRTVRKDEAACVETKMQSPSEAVRGFNDVLHDQVSWRENITSLNIGWTDGGEHGQGMFARNANILPAPMTPLDQCTSTAPTALLSVPHVEHLTLWNCWIAPPVLQGFVNRHQNQALTKLTLKSVSLISHPHPSTHAQQVQAAAVAIANMQAQLAQNHQAMNMQGTAQPLQLLTQQQMTLAQQQVQNQIQQMQQLFQNPAPAFAAPPPPPPPAPPVPPGLGQWWNMPVPAVANANQQLGLGFPFQPLGPGNQNQQAPFAFPPAPPLASFQPPAADQNGYWTNGHRQGSWPDLLNRISPGPVFDDYLPQPQPWEEQRPPRPATSLQAIELISCGYVRLEHNTTFDQGALMDIGRGRDMSQWFRQRYLALKNYMLDASTDKFLGRIVQYVAQHELDAMRFAWGLRVGWADREKAEEAEFDGYLPGGTGRVSGVIERGMPLMDAANAVTPPGSATSVAGPSTV